MIHYFPLVLTGIGIIIIIIITRQIEKYNDSPLVLSAEYFGQYDRGLLLELRQDNSYRIINQFKLGMEVYEGTYIITGDTILLNKTRPKEEASYFSKNKLILMGDQLIFQFDSISNKQFHPVEMRININKINK
jgi:hypothetical protein